MSSGAHLGQGSPNGIPATESNENIYAN